MVHLPLRQRQILNYLKHATSYVTGQELAEHIHTSSRTIRADISQLNQNLSDTSVQIISRHRFGYRLTSEKPDELLNLTRSNETFLSRTERLRHIAFCLCLREVPQNLDQLADEMFISKSTLELDLREFRREYLFITPFIKLIRQNNTIAFENNERKKRRLLCHLFSTNWNYNARGNTFFEYQYLDEQIVNQCIYEVNLQLHNFSLRLEDVNVVHLNLMVSIMIHRLRDGYILEKQDVSSLHPLALRVTESLISGLENNLSCHIPQAERDEICELISCSILPDINLLRKTNPTQHFPKKLTSFVWSYLGLLKKDYSLDFYSDQDVYLSLLIYLDYLQRPLHHLNFTGVDVRSIREYLSIEFELAFRIQPLAQQYYGSYLDLTELYYLMNILSGAIHQLDPDKLRCVIMVQYNIPVALNLRRRLEEYFSNRIQVVDILPVHLKDSFNFSGTDLILTTAQKEITENSVPSIYVTPFFSNADQIRVQQFLDHTKLGVLYRKPYPDIVELLGLAEWEEDIAENDYLQLLEKVSKKLVDNGYAGPEYPLQILHREGLSSFASHNSYIIVHADIPSVQTHIHVVTLKHRIIANGYKIRMLLFLCMHEDDRGILFKLYHELYHSSFDPMECRFLKTKKDFLNFFSNNKRSE